MALVLVGDCRERLRTMPDAGIDCVITSPPYFALRDYGDERQIGLEKTPKEYVDELVNVFREVRRVLKDEGTVWINIGDSYASYRDPQVPPQTMTGKSRDEPVAGKAANRDRAMLKSVGLKHKDLIGIPWMLAFALREDGWYLRQDIIWHKPNPMPESVKDRCTKAHEYIFLLSKSERYYFDYEAIQDASGARKRDVWSVHTSQYSGAHFATFPPHLIEPCVLAGCPKGGTILDPFGGSGTTAVVAEAHDRQAILIELNPKYADMAIERIRGNSIPKTADLTALFGSSMENNNE